MIDIHSHILYGLDDGPKNAGEALDMLRMACEDGIGTVIATPHSNAVCRNSPSLIAERAGEMAGHLRREGRDIAIRTGNECALSDKLLDDLAEGRCLTLAGSRFVLVEISVVLSHAMAGKMLSDIIDKGYIPVVAHCERLVLTRRDMDRIDDLRRMGCLLQMNAETVLANEKGWFNDWAFRKIEDGTISFIASDAHDVHRRKPLLREAYDKVTKLLGAGAADDVFRGNAAGILEAAPHELRAGL